MDWFFIALAVLGLLLALLLFIGNIFFNFALHRHAKYGTAQLGEKMLEKSEGENPGSFSGMIPTPEQTAWFDAAAKDEYIESDDGLRLHISRIDHENSHDYAIVCHGYICNARDMICPGARFFRMGFHVWAPDARAHGKSKGTVRGMGWLERKDMLNIIALLLKKDPDARILLYGISMGGATVMMTAGEPLPAQVKLIIEDCGYTCVWDEFAIQMKQLFHLPSFPIMHFASFITKLRGGYSLQEANAAKQVAKCNIPMLFIHGEDDAFVPFFMLDTVYRAAACEKEKLVIPGAGHGLASSVAPELYWNTVAAFIQKHFQ